MIEINYHQFECSDYKDSALSIDGVGFEPENVYTNEEKSVIYYNCPVWQHKAQRTFIIKSPVDIAMELQFDNNGPTIWCPNISQTSFDRWISGTFSSSYNSNINWHTNNRTTIQIRIPRFLFWTKEKNVWVEIRPHPYTAVKNNFVTIGGWFNISSWVRELSFAFDVVDVTKPIVIKRGDPIYEVCFYSNDLNNKIKLIKKEPSQKIIDLRNKNINVKKYGVRNLISSFLFKKQETKCPFHFLWSNTPQDKG